MKVKISYSVPIEQVPSVVQDLIEKANPVLEKIHKKYHFISETSKADIESVAGYKFLVESIAELRTLLLDFDKTTMEADSILQGYLQYLSQEEENIPVSVDEPSEREDGVN